MNTMNYFDQTWISYTEDLTHPQNEARIVTEIRRANKIVFVAKGRVGLAAKMFMQRLSQLGYTVAHSEDLLVPQLGADDLVIFVTASGTTRSSLSYVDIAKDVGARTMAITFNGDGAISKGCDVVVEYPRPRTQGLMKSYYEIGFIYLFERIVSLFPEDQFVHTNFE